MNFIKLHRKMLGIIIRKPIPASVSCSYSVAQGTMECDKKDDGKGNGIDIKKHFF